MASTDTRREGGERRCAFLSRARASTLTPRQRQKRVIDPAMELDAEYDARRPNTYGDYIALRSARRAARWARERAMLGLPEEVEMAASSGDRERDARLGESL